MSDDPKAPPKPKKKAPPEPQGPASSDIKEGYVSDQLAVPTWSVLARDLHEGGSIVVLHKAWDSSKDSFVVFPIYRGQDPDQIDPDVWMTWRHELKPPMAGHTRIRDYAEVVEAASLTTKEKLEAVDGEHALTDVEARRRFESGEPGLVALVLRVFHLPRSYRYPNVAEVDPTAPAVPLPFEIVREGATPVLSDEDFDRRLRGIRSALG